ncbi:MAG: sterol desaturase family protein [Rhodospirillales bacterium]|tara:strand:- start:2814 stop:3650 length:837 start_codon:yes stop_codon:yes gene_type:complete
MDGMLASLAIEAVTYVALMVVFTLLAFVSRGRDAFTWSPELRQSALTNVLMLHIGGLNGVLYLLTIVPLISLYHTVGLPVLPESVWTNVPFVLKALVALLVYDFSMYWVHRWLHTGWLWPAHAVHHSDTELHFLSWSRGHFIEQFVIAACMVFSSTWLGFGIPEIFGLALLQGLHQHYVHARLDWNHGFLRHVIVSPQLHRWHHAEVEAAYDKNFASIFPFFDLMFGTYYNPGSAVAVPTGIGNNPDNNVIALILYPFREWGRMLAERRRVDAPVETA